MIILMIICLEKPSQGERGGVLKALGLLHIVATRPSFATWSIMSAYWKSQIVKMKFTWAAAISNSACFC